MVKQRINAVVKNGVFVVWSLVFSVFVVLYFFTTQHGASWQDSGRFQYRILHNIFYDTSLVLSHPFYILLGRLFLKIPFGLPETNINLLSGVGMALALANLAGLITYITKQAWIGLSIAFMMGVAHTVWWLATIAEVYTWNVAGLTAELWLLVILTTKRTWPWLIALAFVNGVGFSIHSFALVPLPIYIAVALTLLMNNSISVLALGGGLLAWCTGASIYLLMIVNRFLQLHNITNVVAEALWGSFGSKVLNIVNIPTTPNLVLSSLNFINILLLLAIWGIIRAPRYVNRLLFSSILSITALELIFFLRYPVPDQFTFILPSLIMISLFAGIGLWAWIDKHPTWKRVAEMVVLFFVVLSPIVYAASPSFLEIAGVEIHRSRMLPFRDEARYWLIPWKHNENSAELFAHSALNEAMPNGIILADSTAQYPLLLVAQHGTKYNNIWIPSWLKKNEIPEYTVEPNDFCRSVDNRPLYIVSPVKGYINDWWLENISDIERQGPLFRISLKKDICKNGLPH